MQCWQGLAELHMLQIAFYCFSSTISLRSLVVSDRVCAAMSCSTVAVSGVHL